LNSNHGQHAPVNDYTFGRDCLQARTFQSLDLKISKGRARHLHPQAARTSKRIS